MPWGQEDQLDSEIESLQIITYEWNELLDGSNDSMNVNGSVTAVDFDWQPGSNEYRIQAITLFIVDNVKFNHDGFGGISALTNGVQVKIKTGGTEYTIANLQDNYDIKQVFGYDNNQIGAGFGVSEDNHINYGRLEFLGIKPKLDSSLSDYIRATVRDDLTALTEMKMSVLAYRIV